MGETGVAVHHIGSTFIHNIYANPVRDISEVDTRNSAKEQLGYQVKGEFAISGRRYFHKYNQAGTKTHHFHIFETN